MVLSDRQRPTAPVSLRGTRQHLPVTSGRIDDLYVIIQKKPGNLLWRAGTEIVDGRMVEAFFQRIRWLQDPPKAL